MARFSFSLAKTPGGRRVDAAAVVGPLPHTMRLRPITRAAFDQAVTRTLAAVDSTTMPSRPTRGHKRRSRPSAATARRDAAACLRRILAACESGRLETPPMVAAYLTGAAAALETTAKHRRP